MHTAKLDEQELIRHALDARERAYAPYSRFQVGCALLDDQGQIHYGCNVENAAYGPTNCAERTALFSAIAAGRKPGAFAAIAIVADLPDPVTPCGVCRQVMSELCPPDLPVICANLSGEIKRYTVAELLPGAFSLRRKNS